MLTRIHTPVIPPFQLVFVGVAHLVMFNMVIVLLRV